MPTTSDTYLRGLLNKDPVILKQIYTDFASKINQMVTKNGGTKEDGRDVFQEALLIVWRKAQAPDFELTSGFYTFLYGVAVNIWRRKRKKKDNNTVTIATAEGLTGKVDIQSEMETNEKHRIFRQHFTTLGSECQRILSLFFKGKSMMEIAKLMNIGNDHAARNRKYRCQKKLEERIKKDPRYQELIS